MRKKPTVAQKTYCMGKKADERQGDGSFVLTKQKMDDMISTRKVIICPGRREKSRVREYTM
jgi:hypothetical protein